MSGAELSGDRGGGELHILLTPSWYPSEQFRLSGTFFRDQAEALRETGMRVGVIAPLVMGGRAWLRSGRPSLGIDRGRENGVTVYRKITVPALPRFSRRNMWFWVRAGRALYDDYVRDHGVPDLIHAHSALYGGFLARTLNARRGVPYVITEHHTAFARGRLRKWQRRGAARAFAHAAARIAVSPQLGALLTAQFGDAFCPWHAVPNTLNGCFEDPGDRLPRSDGSGFTFLTVAQFHQKKAQHILIRAFAEASRDDAKLRLQIVGAGARLGPCRDLADELGVGDRIEFTGPLPPAEVRRAMLAADAFVLPSYCETFGVVVIEALACGLPVIATSSGGPESIIDRTNGLVVPPGDVASLSAALIEMRHSIGRYDPDELRRNCLGMYGQAAVARQLTNILHAALPADRR